MLRSLSLLLLGVLTQDQLCFLFGLADLEKVVVCSLDLLLAHVALLGLVVCALELFGLFLRGLFEVVGLRLF